MWRPVVFWRGFWCDSCAQPIRGLHYHPTTKEEDGIYRSCWHGSKMQPTLWMTGVFNLQSVGGSYWYFRLSKWDQDPASSSKTDPVANRGRCCMDFNGTCGLRILLIQLNLGPISNTVILVSAYITNITQYVFVLSILAIIIALTRFPRNAVIENATLELLPASWPVGQSRVLTCNPWVYSFPFCIDLLECHSAWDGNHSRAT